MWDVLADLLLGGRCAACGAPGRSLCPSCAGLLPRAAAPAWPTPAPPGLALPVAAGPYAGVLEALVNAHKEDQVFALAAPLGDVLATAVHELLHLRNAAGGSVLLVPVPSRPSTVRRRGHDPLLRVTRSAAARLRRTGAEVRVCRLLQTARRVEDQTRLDAAERAVNLAGAFRSRRLAPAVGVEVVVVDDVITTGATAREAQRALEVAGFRVLGVASVAATRRRSGQSGGPLPLSGSGD